MIHRVTQSALHRLSRLALWLLVLLPISFRAAAQHPNPAFDYQRLSPYYENQVIKIKFRDGQKIRLRDGVLVDARFDQQAMASRLFGLIRSMEAQGCQWERSHAVPESFLDSIRLLGMERGGQPLPDLNLYFTLRLPAEMSPAQAIAEFVDVPEVEWAYLIPRPVVPPTAPRYDRGTRDDLLLTDTLRFQGYLLPAPDGIDAHYAWEGHGGSGDGVSICDIEYSVNFSHEDLNRVTLLGVPGQDPFASDAHGTEVIGIFGSRKNGIGTTGIAYSADRYFAAQKPVTVGVVAIDQAITTALKTLRLGDVIIIEAQTVGPNFDPDNAGNTQFGLVPVDWDKPVYDAVQIATAIGITVVEAGCNGGQNLDAVEYITLNQNPGFSPFTNAQRSRAIVVGAGKSPRFDEPNARSRHGFSNYGNRIDLQAWGDNVVTSGKGTLWDVDGKNQQYSNNFSGTSSATPMVTGSVAVLQSTFHRAKGRYMFPHEVLDLLRRTGTPQQGTDNIGPMPDLRRAIDEIWGDETLTPAPPVFSPSPQLIHPNPIQVRLAYGPGQSSGNTSIRYTLNGTEPTENSPEFLPDQDDYIYQRYSNTIRAKSFVYNPVNGRLYASPTATAAYRIEQPTPVVDPVTFNPTSTTFETQLFVFLSCATPDAEIRYTMDGSVPDENAQLYSGGIVLSASTRIRARAFRDGYYPSQVITEQVYSRIEARTAALPSPEFHPAAGTYVGGVAVSLKCAVTDAAIYYTLDGSEPTESSLRFYQSFVLTAGATVRARAFKSGRIPSAVSAASYEVSLTPDAPVITPAGGRFTGSTQVQISSSVPGAVIRYTRDGSDPRIYSTRYDAPFSLGVGKHVVTARVFLPGGLRSERSVATFTVDDPSTTTVQDPVITPQGGNYTGSVQVQIACFTRDAEIRYTLDGSDPDAGGIRYTGPITLGAGQTQLVRARAYRTGLTRSGIRQMNYNVFAPVGVVDSVFASPPGGVYHNSVRVALSTTTAFAQIAFSTSGNDPLENGAIYGAPVTISRSGVLRAVATRLAFTNSAELQEEYVLRCADPVIVPGGGMYRDSVLVSLKSETENARIYYTLDGSEPTENSNAYDRPFALRDGTYTVRVVVMRSGFENSFVVTDVLQVRPTPASPRIDTEPQDLFIDEGSEAVFHIDVSGDELEYEWMKDGNTLSGETASTLRIPATGSFDEGLYQVRVFNESGSVLSRLAELRVRVTTSADAPPQPVSLTLHGNYPNPFRENTTISFQLECASSLRLEVYDLTGALVRIIADGTFNSGVHQTRWDATDAAGRPLPSGRYFLRLSTPTESVHRLLVIAR